ncbi:MAG: hypothetical protein LBC50_00045 [Candidatus Ancillula sp.]|nr:hypothetical protein [Candidatus Ancillula sp.]
MSISQDEFNSLVSELAGASTHYYQTGIESGFSDEEYDTKKDYLISLVEEDPELATDEYLSLVQKVADGSSLQTNARAVTHEIPMLSLQKSKTLGGIQEYLSKTMRFGAEENGWVLQLKLDGSALSAIYKDGRLGRLSTRGDGQTGEDITAFAKYKRVHIEGLPLELKGELEHGSFEVRGEIFMTIDQFQKTDAGYYALNKLQNDKETVKVKKTEEQMHFSKPRNAGAGIMKPNESGNYEFGYDAYMTFYAYSVIGAKVPSSQTAVEKMEDNTGTLLSASVASSQDFIFVQDVTEQILHTKRESAFCRVPEDVLNGIKAIESLQQYTNSLISDTQDSTCEITQDEEHGVMQNKTRTITFNGQDIPIDGVVVKCFDDERISKLMGNTSHHPSSQIAYKFESEDATTTVEDIEVNVGRTGRLSLRAKVSPVVLDGSNVEYATLHNFDWATTKDVRIGSQVRITLANDIIPYVKAVLHNPEGSTRLEVPETCPLCDFELDKRTLLYRCPNDNCPSRGIKALEQAVGKNFFNIDGLSTRTLQALWDAQLVRDLGDIFLLTLEDLAALPTGETYETDSSDHKKGDAVKLGAKTAVRIYNSIQNAKQAPLDKVLASLNIQYLGRSLGKNLAKRYANIDEIVSLSPGDLEGVDLVSTIKSESIHNALQKRLKLIEKMKRAGVTFQSVNSSASNAGHTKTINDLPLSSQVVVISGSIPGYNRYEARDLVESLGGVSTSSVTSKTTLLVADDSSTSSKVQKAKQLGVRIISADEFLGMCVAQ